MQPPRSPECIQIGVALQVHLNSEAPRKPPVRKLSGSGLRNRRQQNRFSLRCTRVNNGNDLIFLKIAYGDLALHQNGLVRALLIRSAAQCAGTSDPKRDRLAEFAFYAPRLE